MLAEATIEKPFHDIHGRKYLDLKIGSNVFHVKVPFRYNRVMCKVEDHIPIQDLEFGQPVHVMLERRQWDEEIHWVLISIRRKPS